MKRRCIFSFQTELFRSRFGIGFMGTSHCFHSSSAPNARIGLCTVTDCSARLAHHVFFGRWFFSERNGPLARRTGSGARKVSIRLLLCATSVCSVSLWLFFLSNNEPQSTQTCTEKSVYAHFSRKASLTQSPQRNSTSIRVALSESSFSNVG